MRCNMRRKTFITFITLLLLGGGATQAEAKLRVVATVPDLAAIARANSPTAASRPEYFQPLIRARRTGSGRYAARTGSSSGSAKGSRGQGRGVDTAPVWGMSPPHSPPPGKRP